MHSPLVTIVIPCYNQARFLPEALASVIGQTCERWEAIVVNDGSSDDTATVARQLIDRHPGRCIRLIEHANRGLGASRNAGIAAGTAPYVLPLDADDMIAPEMLERTLAAFDNDTAGFVTTGVRFFAAERGVWSGGEPSRERLIYDCRMVVTSLFRREAWRAAGGFYEGRDMPGSEDWDFWLRLVELGWEGRHVPAPLVWYRRRPGSMLNLAQRGDLSLRARIVSKHAQLYPPAFASWADAVLREARATAQVPWVSRLLWWRWFAWYALLVGRYAPHELPKTLLRPLFKLLGPRQQMYARAVARLLGLSRSS